MSRAKVDPAMQHELPEVGMRESVPTAAFASLLALSGCLSEPPAPAPARSSVAVSVAALSLEGVGDVVWDVEVRNGASTPQVVWQRRLSSSAYGDGAGSASYVGPCDADPAAALNVVRVWVVGVFEEPVSALGSFASGAAGAVAGDALPFENPTLTAPLERSVVCSPNADAAVQFDVALMRPAQQGFFDIAVSFNDIFCSAKFDCCAEGATPGTCASDLTLLFDASGARATTFVLGLACTAGPRAGVETELFLDPLALDCTSPTNFTTGFDADLSLDPSGPSGNLCQAGALSACPAVTEAHGLDADTYLFQLATYRGVEDLASGGVDAQKVYWNVALGVKRPAIGACWLRTRATADDALGTPAIDHGTIAAGVVYPTLHWEVDLGSCAAEPLSFGGAGGMVVPRYTATTGGATTFTYGFGPSLPAGPFVTAPALAPSAGQATALTFPTTPTLGTANVTVSFTNSGGSTGSVATPTVTGAHASAFAVTANTCASVAAGASCALTLTYAPTAAGTHTAAFSAAGASFTLSGTAIAACTDTAPRVYTFTGAVVTATVPAGCTTLRGELWGAGGGGAATSGRGGGGGYTVVSGVPVTAGATYAVVVGQGGASPCDGVCGTGNATVNAFGGGGRATQANGGGGYSGVFSGATPSQAAALAIAGGGGGGGGGACNVHGGAGGGASGAAAVPGTCNTNHVGGAGGTQTAGGAAGFEDYGTAQAGAALQGGSTWTGGYGGGGGGGYWGGGSGGRETSWNHRGGGGGSGFVAGGAGTLTAGSGTTPGNTASLNYAAGVAVGSGTLNVPGGHGRVVIWFE